MLRTLLEKPITSAIIAHLRGDCRMSKQEQDQTSAIQAYESLLDSQEKANERLRKKNMSLGAQLTNLKKELEHSEKLIQEQQQKLRTIVKDKQQIIDELTEKEEKRATVIQRASNRLEFALMSLQEELEGEST